MAKKKVKFYNEGGSVSDDTKSDKGFDMSGNFGGFTLGFDGLLEGANALVTNFIHNPQVRQREMQLLRQQLQPVTSPTDFAGGEEVPLFRRGGKVEDDGTYVKTRRGKKGRIQVEEFVPDEQRPSQNITPMETLSSFRPKFIPKEVPLPGVDNTPNRRVSYETVYDRGNNRMFSPVFSGRWSKEDVDSFWTSIPDSFSGIPVVKGQAWEEMWSNILPGTTSEDWMKPRNFEKGGVVFENHKVNPMNANVLAEDGELLQLPDGSTDIISGDKHSDPSGGEYLNLPEGTRIFSDSLKMDKKEARDIAGVNFKNKPSISKVAKKFNTKKEDSIKNNPLSDPISLRTADIMRAHKEEKLSQIFDYQESMKNNRNVSDIFFMQEGGKAQNKKVLKFLSGQPMNYDEKYEELSQLRKSPNLHQMNTQSMEQFPVDIEQREFNKVGRMVLSPYTIEKFKSGVGWDGEKRLHYRESGYSPQYQEYESGGEVDKEKKKEGTFAGNALRKIGKSIGNASNFVPEMVASLQAMSDFPIFNAKYQPRYLNTPNQLNINDALQSQVSAVRPFMTQTSGNASIDSARALQAQANLLDASNQLYTQKFNVDNQMRQRQQEINTDIENTANLENLRRTDEFWDKVTRRKAIKDTSLQNVAQSAYHKKQGLRRDERALDLTNQMFPNFQYNPNTGMIPVQDGEGNIFFLPYNYNTNSDDNINRGTTTTIGPDGKVTRKIYEREKK